MGAVHAEILGPFIIVVVLLAPRSLTMLRMCFNEIRNRGAKAIAEGLRVNRTLSLLEYDMGPWWCCSCVPRLRSNLIGDEGALVFAEIIRINSTLLLLE